MPRKNLNNRLLELEKSREEDYGSFNRNMKKIAAAWSILLDKYLKEDIPGWIVPLLYAQAKIIRATHKYKEDTYDDALAYGFNHMTCTKKKTKRLIPMGYWN